MERRSGAQISRDAFLGSAAILLALMVISGILTLVIPAGAYERVVQDAREIVIPGTYQGVPRPDYPVWRWFTAPVEVLWGPDGLTVIVIILFILFVGASFAVLERSGILALTVQRLVDRFAGRKYLLLAIIAFFFMFLGATFGIFEEVVPLIPLIVGLAYSLGWDSLVGLGMSVLATNLGFSAAIANPFTIGVAQELAGLPLFSGTGFRLLVFAATYAIFILFLTRHARKVEAEPSASPVFPLDAQVRSAVEAGRSRVEDLPRLRWGVAWFLFIIALILLMLVTASFIPGLGDYSLPLVGVLFLLGGMGAGLLAGVGPGDVASAAWDGLTGIAPGVPLILMAVSVKHVVSAGGILDTILHAAAGTLEGLGPFTGVILMLIFTLLLEFFVASGSAKAFLLMPILVPLADLLGITRQTTVLAYAFGDGFSNMAYPTNPVLLISLGLTVISYPQWIRWTIKLWFWLLLVAAAALGLAVWFGYGPF